MTYKRPSTSTKPSFNDILQYGQVPYKVYKASQGDIFSQAEILSDIQKHIMKPRTRKTGYKKNKRFTRNKRGMNAYLKPVKIPVRASITWARTSGTTGKWSFKILLSDLIKNFQKTYDEFKILRLSLRWLPNNSTNSSGLCAAVLMDQNGFGELGGASAASWFTTLSAMPGSYVGNRHTSFSLRWKPTEPDARQWRSYERGETNYIVCHFYMADNGAEDSETGGIILVNGIAQGRGLYYNAATVRHQLALQAIADDFEIMEGPSS